MTLNLLGNRCTIKEGHTVRHTKAIISKNVAQLALKMKDTIAIFVVTWVRGISHFKEILAHLAENAHASGEWTQSECE